MDFDFYEFDKNLFLWLNSKHNAFFDVLMQHVANSMLYIAVMVLLIYILSKKYKLKTQEHFGLNAALLISWIAFQFVVCFYIVAPILNSFFLRVRPCYEPGVSNMVHLLEECCADKFGFLAPRACFAFCITTFLFLTCRNQFRALKIFVFILALVVSYSRIYSGAHYPGSVVASDLIGIVLGFLLHSTYSYFKDRLLVI